MIHWSCASIHDTLQALESSFSNSVNQNSSEAKPHFLLSVKHISLKWGKAWYQVQCCSVLRGWGYKRSAVRAAEAHTQLKDVYNEGQANWPPHNPGEPLRSAALQVRRAVPTGSHCILPHVPITGQRDGTHGGMGGGGEWAGNAEWSFS